MTDFAPTPELVSDLQRDEGLKLLSYPDPLSPLYNACRKAKLDPYTQYTRVAGWKAISGKPWTIGYGHAGSDVTPLMEWTPEKAREVLIADIISHGAPLYTALPWLNKLSQVRQDALLNMVFNMGWDNPRTTKREGLSGFTTSLGLIREGHYVEAAANLRKSLWASQVGGRAVRITNMIQTGRR